MFRKLFSSILGVVLVVSLVGCSSGSSSSDSTPKPTEEALVEPEYNASECVELGTYEGLKVTINKDDYKVTKSDIIKTINEALFDESKDYVEVKKKVVSSGDILKVDFVQNINGQKTSEKNYILKLRGSDTPSDIKKGLVGHKVGEKVKITQKSNSSNKVEVTIKAILGVSDTAMTYDKLTDSYVKQNFSFKTVKQYYNSVKSGLEMNMSDNMEKDLESKLLIAFVNTCRVKIPDNLLDYEYKVERKAMATQLISYGYTNIKDYLKASNMTMKQYNARVKEYSRNKLTSSLVLEAVSDKKGMKFDKEGYKAYKKIMIRRSGYSSEAELKKSYKESYIRKMYVTQYKPMQYIIKKAKITYSKK